MTTFRTSNILPGCLLGALLATGCSTDSLTGTSDSSNAAEAPGGSVQARQLDSSDLLARGLLPGADLSRQAFSQDGNLVVFCSQDATLVDGDNNAHSDVFVYSRFGSSFRRVSLSGSGQEPNGPCWRASISADGRYVVFDSSASNLVANDTNNRVDVFRKDLQTGEVKLVSVGLSGQSNGSSDQAVVSQDGQFVAFRSAATNLVTGDTNRVADIFVRDLQSNLTQVVNRSGSGLANRASANPSIDASGRYISFETASTNLVGSGGGQPVSGRSNVFVRDVQTSSLYWCSRRPDGGESSGSSHSAHLSGSGSRVAFVSTSSEFTPSAASGEQIYSTPISSPSFTLVSRSGGTPANGSCQWPVMDYWGQYVAYLSKARNLVAGKNDDQFDVFVSDSAAGTTSRRSNPGGASNDAGCEQLSMSSDGQRTIFRSLASTLGAADADGDDDIYSDARDQVSKSKPVTRVSLSMKDEQPNGPSGGADTSTTGRYVAFRSSATNLVQGDDNNANDIFLRDTEAGRNLELISTGPSGQANANSDSPDVTPDGRYVAFLSIADNLAPGDTNSTYDIFLRDTTNQTTTLISTGASGIGNSSSFRPRVSADGRYVVFYSYSGNLVAGDNNGTWDVFLRDTLNGTTILISTGALGQANGSSFDPSISADGRYIAFYSEATNLTAGDANGARFDVFVRDRVAETTTLVSTGASGQGNLDSTEPAISANGRYVAFRSTANNLVGGDTNGSSDVFRRDTVAGLTNLISSGASGPANGDSSGPSISTDGRFVSFVSIASNLLPGDALGFKDVFLRDTVNGLTTCLTEGANLDSAGASISGDGQFVSFSSAASNLVGEDTNAAEDVFLRRLLP